MQQESHAKSVVVFELRIMSDADMKKPVEAAQLWM